MKNSVITVYDQSQSAVDIDEAKTRLKLIDREDFDLEVTRLIKTATQYLERRYGIAILTQTRQQRQDNFEFCLPYSSLKLLYPPVQSVSTFQYTKEDGTTGTLVASTDYGTSGMMTSVVGAQDILQSSVYPITSWPAIKNVPEAVRITYVCGFGINSTFVPEPIREAILRLVVFMFENPQDEVSGNTGESMIGKFEMGIDSLMSTYETFGYVRDENRLSINSNDSSYAY